MAGAEARRRPAAAGASRDRRHGAAGHQGSGHRGRAFVGCSGWQYPTWRGPFYPRSLPASRWLAFYAGQFSTVEINNTFYRLPERPTFASWRSATPAGFVIAVKASRYLTHLKRLRGSSAPLERLYRRCFALGSRLGPILYQLPGTLAYDPIRLRSFIRALSAQGRRALARRPPRGAERVRRLRHVIEFRHPSWYRGDVFDVLRRARIAVCLHDMAGSEIDQVPGSPFLYVRFHGTEGRYRGSYSDAALRGWSRRLRAALAAGRDVYAYFNNDLDGAAVANARTLIRYVGRP